MKVVFLGAYFNHHQKPLSDALARRCEYTYIATSRMPQMRKQLGYGGIAEPDYVCRYEEEPDRADKCLQEADVVLTGAAPEKLVRRCILRGQPVFRYSERPLKKGNQWQKYLPRLLKWHWQNPPGKPIYMLCASAYTAQDYARFGLFWHRTFRWGYFPELCRYEDPAALVAGKEKNSILWAGRFLDWKHPDDVLTAVAELKKEGVPFVLRFVGTGELEQRLLEMTERLGLGDCVEFLGSMKPEEVRYHMEQSQIFLFTSDRREGWGAVVNEAMNSGCAVIASDKAGSPPYLIRHGENGMLYPSGNLARLRESLRLLLENPLEALRLGETAYETMANVWNADIAAERFLELAAAARKGQRLNQMYEDGPCSPA